MQNQDSGPVDAAAPDALIDPTIGPIGSACTVANATTCAGHGQKIIVICDAGTMTWTALQVCPGAQLCDSQPGPRQGSCQDPLPECEGQAPGFATCEDATRFVCGPDLVTSTTLTCASAAACENSSGDSCAECGEALDCSSTDATQGTAYAGAALLAYGGAAPYTLSASGLPPGISLSPTGTFSGSPTTPGRYSFTVVATDTAGCTGVLPWTIEVAGATCPLFTLTPGRLTDGSVGTAYAQPLAAAGGTGPYTFSLAGGTLPGGVSLAPNGTLSGTPSASGDFAFSIAAVDAASCSTTQAFALHVNPMSSCGAYVNQLSSTVPGGSVGTTYSGTVIGSGGLPPYSFSVGSGALPPGVTLASDGTLSGTPLGAGDYQFGVTVADSSGCRGASPASFSLHVDLGSCPSISLAPAESECEVRGCSSAGSCTVLDVPDGTVVSDISPSDCNRSVCVLGSATVVLDASENCGANTTCTAIDTCTGQLGAACSATAPSFCDSGKCVDGHCCNSDCNGSCQTCASGTCSPVTSVVDSDTCTSPRICSASGACGLQLGQPCSVPGDCALGSCVPSYEDGDRDSYASSTYTGFRCIDTTHTSSSPGYSDRTGDCCDLDWNTYPVANYRPGLPTGLTADACGNWDYNCNGVIETDYPDAPYCGSCSPSPWMYYWTSAVTCGNWGQLNRNYCSGCTHIDTITDKKNCY